MADNTKFMIPAMLAALLVVVSATMTGCDARTSSAGRRTAPKQTPAAAPVRSTTTVVAFPPPAEEIRAAEHLEPPPAEEVASTLDDARATLGDTMKALAEILDASQKMQRELLDAPERLSSPDEPERGEEGEG